MKDPAVVGRMLDKDTDVILWKVVSAGTHTTAGGDASETITDAEVLATDVVMVMIKTEGATPVTCDRAAAAAGSIAVTMSADPSTDHVLQYVVFRQS